MKKFFTLILKSLNAINHILSLKIIILNLFNGLFSEILKRSDKIVAQFEFRTILNYFFNVITEVIKVVNTLNLFVVQTLSHPITLID